MRYLLSFMAAVLLVGAPACRAGEAEAPPKAEPDPKNVFKIGKVTCYKAERRVEVEGKICIQDGQIEYLAVLSGGKEHESILTFDCKGVDLNLALIGLGYKAAGPTKAADDPNILKGDPVVLFVEWADQDGKPKRVRAEELLFNRGTKKPMRQTAWVFTGSDFARDPDTGKLFIDPETKRTVFLADLARNLIAIYYDPVAIFNSPLDTANNPLQDGTVPYYAVNKELCPKVGTAVKLVLEPAAKDALDPEKLKDGAGLVKREDGVPPTKEAPKPAPEK
jgi:hypothetical protein